MVTLNSSKDCDATENRISMKKDWARIFAFDN
jgi:hypothetical protein